MPRHQDMTEAAIRTYFVQRVDAYCETTGLQPSTVTTRAVGDGKFYQRVVNGQPFGLKVYQRVLDFVEGHERNMSADSLREFEKLEKRLNTLMADIAKAKLQLRRLTENQLKQQVSNDEAA